MRRILLIVAMLVPIAPAMALHVDIAADVNANAHQHDGIWHKTVTITYSATGDVRAFALDINVDNGMNIGDFNFGHNPTDFKVGESNSVSKGYGIFPGRFRDFVNPSSPNWQDPNYNPSTPWNSPGAENTGFGYNKVVFELGTLYSGDPNKPNTSGTLVTFDINSEGVPYPFSNDCNMTVAANSLRGGIVGSDANTVTDTNLPFTKKVTFPLPGCTVPNLVGMDRTAAIAAITTAGFSSWKEWSVPGTGQPMRQVVAQLQTSGTVMDCATVIDFNDVNWPIRPQAAIYANWVNRNRPQCWAWPRQCHGDADGKKLGTWVGGPDLAILRSAVSKVDSQIPPTATDPNPGICSDFDHKKLGTWVGGPDLTILRLYVSKADASVPICGAPVNRPAVPDPNYNYWCLPTGGSCPVGHLCTVLPVCPNTP